MHEGAEYVSWNRTNSILADVYDAVNLNTYVLMMANAGDKRAKAQVQEIPPYPRPGVEKAKRKQQQSSNPFAVTARRMLAEQHK